jgi:hypothetical protein
MSCTVCMRNGGKAPPRRRARDSCFSHVVSRGENVNLITSVAAALAAPFVRGRRGSAPPEFSAATVWAVALIQAFVVCLMLHMLRFDPLEEAQLPSPLHMLRDGTLAVPLSLGSVVIATLLARRIVDRTGLRDDGIVVTLLWALAGAALYGLASLPATWAYLGLFGDENATQPFAGQVLYDGATVAVAALGVLAATGLAGYMPWVLGDGATAAAARQAPRPEPAPRSSAEIGTAQPRAAHGDDAARSPFRLLPNPGVPVRSAPQTVAAPPAPSA